MCLPRELLVHRDQSSVLDGTGSVLKWALQLEARTSQPQLPLCIVVSVDRTLKVRSVFPESVHYFPAAGLVRHMLL